MHVGGRCAARTAHQGDGLAGGNEVAGFDHELIVVGIARPITVAVVDLDQSYNFV